MEEPTMHRPGKARLAPIAAALALLALAAPTSPALALEQGPYAIEILVDGMPLDEIAARGAVYVEALQGREYSIRLSNRTGERIGVALSVDGLNTIDAKSTPAREARKWILGPWQTVTLDGWQTGASTARRFYFTSEPDSYGARLGKTRNLGLISAAVFREKQAVAFMERQDSRLSGRADAPAAAPSAEKRSKTEASGLSDELAATGIGRETHHRVVRVDFEPDDRPASVLNVRYEYRDALVRLGVVDALPCDDDLARRERAGGFDDLEFAPDPYRPRRRR
jgi:hypothetical protein